MKIYMSIDMEGIAGTFSWKQETTDRKSVKKYMYNQLEWVIEGIKQSKVNNEVDEILIADSHSMGDSISYEITSFDDRVHLISGGNRPQYMMPALDETYDIVFFIGYHGGVGRINAAMDHSYSSSTIHKIWMNDIPMNETLVNSAYAGYYSIPVGLVIGDLALKNELSEFKDFNEVEYVITKEAISRFSAKSRPMNKIKEESILAVKNALEKDFSKLPIYKYNPPITLKIELTNTAMADMVSLMPSIERLDGRTVKLSHNDYKKVLDSIMAIVLLAHGVR